MPVDSRVVEDLTFPCIISCVVGMEGHRTVEPYGSYEEAEKAHTVSGDEARVKVSMAALGMQLGHRGTGKRECIRVLGSVCWVPGCGPRLRL